MRRSEGVRREWMVLKWAQMSDKERKTGFLITIDIKTIVSEDFLKLNLF